MKDVELVIKIPERIYNTIMSTQSYIFGFSSEKSLSAEILKAIRTGIPLSKGHGILVDVDAVIEWLKDIIKMSYQENNAREDMLKSVPTILEDLSSVTPKESILDKLKAEIEFNVDRRNMLCAEDVFAIIDKYKAESEE